VQQIPRQDRLHYGEGAVQQALVPTLVSDVIATVPGQQPRGAGRRVGGIDDVGSDKSPLRSQQTGSSVEHRLAIEIAQMMEDPHCEDDIEALAESADVRGLDDREPGGRREAPLSLRDTPHVVVNADVLDTGGKLLYHASRPASDIEHTHARPDPSDIVHQAPPVAIASHCAAQCRVDAGEAAEPVREPHRR
jgi:hypothetical protein